MDGFQWVRCDFMSFKPIHHDKMNKTQEEKLLRYSILFALFVQHVQMKWKIFTTKIGTFDSEFWCVFIQRLQPFGFQPLCFQVEPRL